MKRRDEGYILIYVLVVVVVLCAIVTGVCTVALRNLQTQERSIQRTRALYEAEGAIEEYHARARSISKIEGDGNEAAAVDAFKGVLRTTFLGTEPGEKFSEIEGLTLDRIALSKIEDDKYVYTVEMHGNEHAEDITMGITATMEITVHYSDETPSKENEEEPAPEPAYKMTVTDISWKEYQITQSASDET